MMEDMETARAIPESPNLIRNLFQNHEFVDRGLSTPLEERIDVILPILHSNDMFHENLTSLYREVPVNRLIVGDAGCIDNSLEILSNFPRVLVIEHRALKTLGSSIADLTARLETEKFCYIQSDVYLPNGWYENMANELVHADWIGSPMQVVTMIDYKLDYSGTRPLAGAQLGRSKYLKNLKEFVADDFVYRQEDFVLENYVTKNGGKIGFSNSTFHFHQVMRRKTTGLQMNIQSLEIKLNEGKNELKRIHQSQLYGFIKYCTPENLEARKMALASIHGFLKYSDESIYKLMRFTFLKGRPWMKYIIFGVASVEIKLILKRILRLSR
jgi:hypothetical protein